MSEKPEPDWGWYAGDGEHYHIGPHATREDAVDEAVNDELGLHDDMKGCTFTIIEAHHQPIQLADYVDVGEMVDDWESGSFADMTDPDGCDGLLEHVTAEQWDELQSALRAVTTEWQTRHAIVIKPWVFTGIRNEEVVTVELP